MNIFYVLFILFQFVPAFVLHDKDRMAYLNYLWWSHIRNASSEDARKKTVKNESEYNETKREVTNHGYSLLLER